MAENIKINSTRFGDIEIPESKVISFPEPIAGFPKIREYVILDHDGEREGGEGLFKWLQAVTDPAIAFLLTVPVLFKQDYTLPEKTFPMPQLGLEKAEDAVVMVMVCVTKDTPRALSLNLKAPVVFNHEQMLATQLIIDSDEYLCDFIVKGPPDEEHKADSAREKSGASGHR